MYRSLPLDAFDLEADAVRARFDWAVRNGNPWWLWPDVSTEQWQQGLARIEVIARQVLTEGRAFEPLTGCARTLGIAGFTSGMGPLLGHWIDRGLIEAERDIAAILELHLRHNTARMERMARRAIAVVDALVDGGIPVLVLKGMQTAFAHFPIPGTRPLSDIDLVVSASEQPRAAEILRGLGFVPGAHSPLPPPQQSWRSSDSRVEPRSLEFVHADDPWCIDLQTSLDRRYSGGAPVIRLDALRTPATMDPWALSPKGTVLTPVAQVLHLACHAGCGLGNLSMMRLCELALVIRQGLGDTSFDWEDFIALAQRSDALASAFPALHFCEMLIPGTVPEMVRQLGRSQAPQAVLGVLGRLTPATAQQFLRWSLEERFMWTSSPWRLLREIGGELVAPAGSLARIVAAQRRRVFRLLRGRVTWRFGNSC